MYSAHSKAMSEDIPTPSPGEIDRELKQEEEQESEQQPPQEKEPTETNEQSNGRLSLSTLPGKVSPVDADGVGTLSVQSGVGLVFVGLGLLGVATGVLLYRSGFGLALSAATALGLGLAAAGLSGLFLAFKSRMDRQHDEVLTAIEEGSGFGLPGLNAEQVAKLEHQQALINDVMSDLPEQKARLEALDEAIPTQGEQLRRVAEAQREIWEEIEEEFQ